MSENKRNHLIGFGIFLICIGGIITFAVPYDINSSYTWYNPISRRYETYYSTVTVYGHPAGYIVDGIGFFILFAGLVTSTSSSTSLSTRTFHGKVCGDCYFFGKEECRRRETIFNAMPCEDFTP